MIVFEIALGIVILTAAIHFWITKRRYEYQTSFIAKQMEHSLEMEKILEMGLYFCFCQENNNDGKQKRYSKIYIKQDPLQFENFCAQVMEKKYGGTTWVSQASGDFGVDFEHRRDDGLYLGQVKCYEGDLSYDPIARLHSNMVKSGANGGYVVTTGSFSENARKFAEGLNIELIDGVKLVEYWLDGLKQSENIFNNFFLFLIF
ncbi:restriction endonuclease family protein [Anoxybacillus sp. B7M1]|uniref:restriction endonuclease n=1 Tax=unclassified Anoxybacillus TaxID=2639704 RepID=UPI000696F356|nr:MULTISPECIES: restriction endonuclease [unclassified Anoxybacillus]ANB59098.1 restriction endonuclease family protein [Anoxybacillus sp. B2M1]ANB63984.1 restriction endonuclease family protein [Anoxybacillus sp. B7M1]